MGIDICDQWAYNGLRWTGEQPLHERRKRTMKNATIQINLSFNEEGKVTDMDIVQGMFNRTEYCMEGVDDPMTVDEVLEEIADYLRR